MLLLLLLLRHHLGVQTLRLCLGLRIVRVIVAADSRCGCLLVHAPQQALLQEAHEPVRDEHEWSDERPIQRNLLRARAMCAVRA